MTSVSATKCLLVLLLVNAVVTSFAVFRDRLEEFYVHIKHTPYETFLNVKKSNGGSLGNSILKIGVGVGSSANIEYCMDRTKLLPDCNTCIPGLQASVKGEICDIFVQDSIAIRNEIKGLTLERYGEKMVANRPFGLYPYLEGTYISKISVPLFITF